MRQAERDRGFSVIEVLVVIVILTVLSAVIIMSTSNTPSEAPEACAADAQAIRTAAESYYADNADRFAPDLQTLRASGHLRSSPPSKPTSGPITAGNGPNGYVMELTPTSADPVVHVWGADRSWGTPDDTSGGPSTCSSPTSGL